MTPAMNSARAMSLVAALVLLPIVGARARDEGRPATIRGKVVKKDDVAAIGSYVLAEPV